MSECACGHDLHGERCRGRYYDSNADADVLCDCERRADGMKYDLGALADALRDAYAKACAAGRCDCPTACLSDGQSFSEKEEKR